MRQEKQNHEDAFSQAVTSKQATRGTNATTQASGPKDRQAQAHGGHKAWQNLDLDKQTWL